MSGEFGDFCFIIRRWGADVGVGSQDRKGVDSREKKRDGRGIDTTY